MSALMVMSVPSDIAYNFLHRFPRHPIMTDTKHYVESKDFIESAEPIDRKDRYASSDSSTATDKQFIEGDGEQPDYNDKEVLRILRKVDYRLPPVLAILYLFSFLDRSNIGNAKIAGMTRDLNMTGHDYNIALTVFFFPYAIGMIPSNMILKRVRPSTWLAFLMTGWGIAMMCHGWCQTKGQLMACRCILGLFEAGFMPAAQYLCTLWYCRFELQRRIAYFWCSAMLAGAFSGLLAYFIEKMDGIRGYGGWRWIFILEGIATIVIGISTNWLLPNSPRSCKFLATREKDILERRLAQDSGTDEGTVKVEGDAFQWSVIKRTLSDGKLWLAGLVVCGHSIPLYAFTFFCPTIIKGLGFKTWRAQLLQVPMYMLAFVAAIAVAFMADRRKTRWPFVVYPYLVASVGFLALLAIPHPKYNGLTYAFMYLIPLGLSCGVNSLLAWIANNLAPSWNRAIGIAFASTLANFGGAIGANIFLEEEAPRYPLGFGFSFGVLCAGVVAALVMRYILLKLNRARDQLDVKVIKDTYTQEELWQLGDRSPLYRYVV